MPTPPPRSDRPSPRYDRPGGGGSGQGQSYGGNRRPDARPAFRTRSEPRLPTSAAPPVGSDQWLKPWAQMKYFSFNPAVYPNMISALSREAAAGDLIHVYDKEGQPFGTGFFNPKA